MEINTERAIMMAVPAQTYRKRHVGNLDAEWERARSLYEAGCIAPHFRAPRPVALHQESREIEYEHLPAGGTLRRHIHAAILDPRRRRFARTAGWLAEAGRALADLHRVLKVTEPRPVDIDLSGLPDLEASVLAHAGRRMQAALHSPFHGDYWQGNLWVGDAGLIVFDPVPNLHGPDASANVGSIYYDIGYMVFSLWAVYPAWLLPLHRPRRVREYCAHFLAGYEETSRQTLERTTIHVLALHWLDRYVELMPRRLGRTIVAVRRPLIRIIRNRLLDEIHRWATTEKVT